MDCGECQYCDDPVSSRMGLAASGRRYYPGGLARRMHLHSPYIRALAATASPPRSHGACKSYAYRGSVTPRSRPVAVSRQTSRVSRRMADDVASASARTPIIAGDPKDSRPAARVFLPIYPTSDEAMRTPPGPPEVAKSGTRGNSAHATYGPTAPNITPLGISIISSIL